MSKIGAFWMLALGWVMSWTPHSQGASNNPRAKPDFFVTAAWPGPANVSRFCIGNANRLYVTVRRQGGSGFDGPIAVWLTGRSLTGTLPVGAMQQIEYIPGANSWLVIFRDIPIAAEWKALDGFLTVIVNPEANGKRSIVESNYNNNSYSMSLRNHADWSRKC
jgi:hypothetical protein